MSQILALVFIAIVSITLVGDWFLKKASMSDNWVTSPYLLAGLFFYMVSGVGIVVAMRHMSLAEVGVWYAVLTILFMTGLGVFAFGETLTLREGVGIVLAFAALGCMARFA